VQRLVELRFDCDSDAILLRVDQTGPACHTNRRSCFYNAAREGGVSVISEPVAD
jgi:phosphoribosyl-AMP cyclohydrolase